ncbi:metastasis-associated protein MTA3 isoform X4 [Stegostoma tigrinum]|uniref:metastasis-associated protein MTA3 isoform X4 n=1 Tax=Stegostoma tigrinum TaxID=3053191 RepID=UPI00202B50AA|nr:metastasis-associated protein MTA3 isoform X4 [Stegostoma tigrinum]
MAANMYRVGDYVYFENSSSNPYLIRRIEELNKTPSGNVEAKVVCFYRRRDISNSLVVLADKHAKEMEEELETPSILDLTEKQRHQLKHREIFLSRQYESLPATHIRGKCGVSLLNETESVACYLEKEDGFFYSLVYDPSQKTLLADKGEIRVGSRYQADISDMLNEGESDARDQSKMEVKVWDPDNPLNDRQIDQFLVVARAVGTFARALDCSSSVRQPSLHMSAAAASRDITLFHAMDTLHKHNYDLTNAISILVPQGGPVLCRDEMEEWSASEASLFEEALEKYGKDFNDIRQDFLPWKSLTSIIEYYYMWKTTDRYVQQKRLKAAEAESKLKQVYIPTYNKPNPNQISDVNGKPAVVNGPVGGVLYQTQNSSTGRPCESCYTTQSQQWYSWGPPNMQCRLCASCWTYWKKYGGLKMPTRAEAEKMSPTDDVSDSHIKSVFHHGQPGHGVSMHIDGPKSTLKTRQSFFLQTTRLTKLARHVCRDILRLKQAARKPFVPINCAAIKAECTVRFPEAVKRPLNIKVPLRKPLTSIIKYLGKITSRPLDAVEQVGGVAGEALSQLEGLFRALNGEVHPAVKPEVFRRVSSLTSGNFNQSSKRLFAIQNRGSPTIPGNQSYSLHNGVDGNMKQRRLMSYRDVTSHAEGMSIDYFSYLPNGKVMSPGIKAVQPAPIAVIKRQRPNWIDAPVVGFFAVTEEARWMPSSSSSAVRKTRYHKGRW